MKYTGKEGVINMLDYMSPEEVAKILIRRIIWETFNSEEIKKKAAKR